MKAIDRRKLFAALHRGSKALGLEMQEAPDAGSGSHGSLIFIRGEEAAPLRLVLAYSREISPGVQRGIRRYVISQVELRRNDADKRLATDVLSLLDDCMK